jgi:hypothetical protein
MTLGIELLQELGDKPYSNHTKALSNTKYDFNFLILALCHGICQIFNLFLIDT